MYFELIYLSTTKLLLIVSEKQVFTSKECRHQRIQWLIGLEAISNQFNTS